MQSTQVNEQIRDREIRVIGEDGEQLGIMSAKDAIKLAEERELDLVKISPNAIPPVCKIMNFGKFKFEQAKKDKEAKKNQKVTTVKEIRLSATIDTHDIEVKAKNAVKFLSSGDKVKVSIRFKGRQLSHKEIGNAVMDSFFKLVEEVGTIEKPARIDGKSMIMIVAPKS